MKKLIFIVLLMINSIIYGQYETANWYFGENAGISFVSGFPIAITGGLINVEEGMSSISNNCGELLFYTDGVTIWDKNHTIMPNGNNLSGDSSSTQSSIIIPKPNNSNMYYVFSIDDGFVSPSNDGITYSVVDLNLNNENGDIISGQKNILLIDHASEKVAAVHASDGIAVWVVFFAPLTTDTNIPFHTQGSNYNTFYAFKITPSGISSPTISQLNISVNSGAGYMKISPDGSKIALANMNSQSAFLFNFDNTTGVVSNETSLTLPANADYPYGLEFSPDSSKLYISDKGNGSSGSLIQYNLTNNNLMTVISTNQNYRSALQLAPNGKIYQTHTTSYGNGSNTMSVISNPNADGINANYQYQLINLGTGVECHQGLPSFIASSFNQQTISQIYSNTQDVYEIDANTEINSIDWDFDDGTTQTTYPDNAPDNTHTQATHVYSTQNIYNITAIMHLSNGCDISLSTNNYTVPNDITDKLLNKVSLYPNPTKQTVYLKLGELQNVTITVTDISGKIIYTDNDINTQNYNLIIEGKKGLYFVKISSDNHSIIHKLILN